MLWVHSPAVDGCSTNRLLEVRILSPQPRSRVSASRNMCSRGCHGRRIRRSNAADRIKGGSRAIFRALRASELAVDQVYLKMPAAGAPAPLLAASLDQGVITGA